MAGEKVFMGGLAAQQQSAARARSSGGGGGGGGGWVEGAFNSFTGQTDDEDRIVAPDELARSSQRGQAEAQMHGVYMQEQELSDMLGARARGEAPMVADMQAANARAALDQQARSMAAAGVGPQRGLAQRDAMNAAARGQADIYGQAAAAAVAERQQAEAAYGGHLSGMFGQQGGLAQMGQEDQMALLRADLAAQEANAAMAAANAEKESKFWGNLTGFGGGLFGS